MLKFIVALVVALAVTEAVKLHPSKIKFARKQALTKRQAGTTCAENQFMCESGECILAEWACDTQADCSDGSDEKDCQCMCRGEHKFQCSNGKCVPTSFICDAFDDCGDGSDEVDCQSCPREGYVLCAGSTKCVHETWFCDGWAHCPGGYDEANCEPKRCNETTEFTCDNGECIPLIFRCDHGHDCDDASDEALCRTYPVT
ncbi:hypothetical protein C0Q70_09599 [Pomacea canaliculata]|uniref:EGF-like domain-containing protein n=1 Tax=Pomacea canaliculata TaxID=400727 RepID=A0A2T7PA81_POMCA|nr:hypothetical protein C0Q70_09599 [Pomacea canaliculata]